MGFVSKTIKKEVGEISEEVSYHFEMFEDFMTFEKQEKVESDSFCNETSVPVIEIVEGEKYRIKGDYISGHYFDIGEIVTASADSDTKGNAFCETEREGWFVHVSEVEKVE